MKSKNNNFSLGFWKPVKVKTNAVKLSTYPKRSKQENRLIDKHPWGDRDRDRVINIFDCKPLNKRKQGKFIQNIPLAKAKFRTIYHGTDTPTAEKIIKEGLKPPIQAKNALEKYSVQSGNRYRLNKVFLSPNPLTAYYFGQRAADIKDVVPEGEVIGGKYVSIIKTIIPKEKFEKSFGPDPEHWAPTEVMLGKKDIRNLKLKIDTKAKRKAMLKIAKDIHESEYREKLGEQPFPETLNTLEKSEALKTLSERYKTDEE